MYHMQKVCTAVYAVYAGKHEAALKAVSEWILKTSPDVLQSIKESRSILAFKEDRF